MVRNKRDGKVLPGEVYIGRPSEWGNPFVIGEHGTREQVIAMYRFWLWEKCGSEFFVDKLAALHGKTLVCWCAPAPCHGDVLVAAAEWATKQERD